MALNGEPLETNEMTLSWKYWAGTILGWLLSYLAFNLLLPKLPPLWAALLIALLFAIFAVGLPLLMARIRRNDSPTAPQPSASTDL